MRFGLYFCLSDEILIPSFRFFAAKIPTVLKNMSGVIRRGVRYNLDSKYSRDGAGEIYQER